MLSDVEGFNHETGTTDVDENSGGTIPSRKECLKLFKRYVLLSNVEQHCVAVTTLAMYLAEKVKEKKIPNLNLDLVFATSLLHDLAKSSTIGKLEQKKYSFKPFTDEQLKTWGLLRNIYRSMEDFYNDLNSLHPNLNRTVHETDVTSIIVGVLHPGFVHYIHQIGGTKNPVYFNAGVEIKIMHYADWRIHKHDLIPFEVRLDYLFNVYWNELPDILCKARKEREFKLEKELFHSLDITPKLEIEELNKKKSDLFGREYDYFKIDKKDKI